MSVIGYFETFPQKSQSELRTVTFPEDIDSIPAGIYLFAEYFCTDLNCNCQRVIIKVLNPKSESDRNPREVATISYTWSIGEDEVWRNTNSEFANPFLDPFHPQASFADELLEFWSDMVARDRAYAQRLVAHYQELRAKKGKSERHATAFDPSAFDAPPNREERRRLRKSKSGKHARR
jgi:hypothetical protein